MASLTPEQIAWAASVGIAQAKAEWLADCPKFTRWDYVTRPSEDRNLWRNGSWWYLRLRRQGVQIVERLSTDVSEARRMRDARLSNKTP